MKRTTIAILILTTFLIVNCSPQLTVDSVPATATSQPAVTPNLAYSATGTPIPDMLTNVPELPDATFAIPNSQEPLPLTEYAATKNYIGLEYPPLPENITTSSSWSQVISPSTSSNLWSVNIVGDHKVNMLWLSRRTFVDINGKAHWRVSDVVILPIPEEDRAFIASACLLEGVLEPEIIVLARTDDATLKSRYLLKPNIILAWKASQTTGKLALIGTGNIECYAELFLSYP